MTVSAAFALAAKHYAVGVDLCPPRHGNRTGVVEKANHSAAQRWWRTVADDATVTAAGQSLDELCERLDRRTRRRGGEKSTVAELAAGEGLRAAPATAYPAELTVVRTVSAQALVSFRGNRYSVPPGCPAPRSWSGTGSAPTGCGSSPPRARPSRSTAAPPNGVGATVRDDGHVSPRLRPSGRSTSGTPCLSSEIRRPPWA
jgi:hypothetical protein